MGDRMAVEGRNTLLSRMAVGRRNAVLGRMAGMDRLAMRRGMASLSGEGVVTGAAVWQRLTVFFTAVMN